MRDPCKLMITQEGRFAQPHNQADLLSNKTTQQEHETCPPHKKKTTWWHEAHILPSKLSKLMTPWVVNLSAHVKTVI